MRYLIVLLLIAMALPARAAKPVEATGLVKMLAESMTGRAVMGAGVGYAGPKASYNPEDLKRAGSLIEKCQVIATAASKDDRAIIPFQVGKAYVLAPETREDVVTDFRGTPALEAMSPFAIITDVLTGLTDAQLQQFGSSDGVAVANLFDTARAELAYLFQPPLKMPDGTLRDEPLDWGRARLRGRVAPKDAIVPGPSGYEANFAAERGANAGIAPTRRFATPIGVSAPALREVPNAFKPSDLTGKAFTQPFGASGVLRVEDAAARIAKTTGLRLHVARVYRDVPFFVGSSAVSCGDVMDGLRLSLQGAWRRMGDDFILAWGVRGIGALSQLAAEAGRTPAILAAKKRDMDHGFSNRWADIVAALSPDPDDPLALTDKQKQLLFESRNADARIPFQDMTPAQQKYLIARAGDEGFFLPPDGEGPRSRRGLTLEDIQQAYFTPNARVSLDLKLPDKGWLPVQSPPPYGWMTTPLETILRYPRPARREPEPLPAAPPERPAEGSLAMPSDIRGVMVPVLTPGVLEDVVKTMKRHGFNTLLYPALVDGYATFPNTAFPVEPKLKEQDGWAMAAASAKAAGLRMVGYVSALAWRGPEDKVHWLDRHPEWVDTDIASRTRRAWVAEHPAWRPPADRWNMDLWRVPNADFARPLEPAVTSKLDAFLDALAKRAPSGVMLVDWKPSVRGPSEDLGSAPPALGYAMPERLASVRATGDDLVDELSSPYNLLSAFIPRIFDTLGIPRTTLFQVDARRKPPTPDAWTDLASRALTRLKTARPDLATWLVENPLARPIGPPAPLPKADLVLTTFMELSTDLGSKPGYLLPVAPRSAHSADDLARRGYRPMADLLNVWGAEDLRPPKAIVFDFRDAPEEIQGAVRRFRRPTPGSPQARHPLPGGEGVFGG